MVLATSSSESNNHIHIFIVFHNIVNSVRIFNHKFYTKDKINEKFTFFGVNELYEKQITEDKGYNTIYEYDLDIYNPFLQKRGYMETSVYLHVYWNNLHKDLDFVGFCQYDMIHNNPIPFLDENTIVVQSTHKNIVAFGKWQNMMCPKVRNLKFLLDSYNKHFDKKFTIQDLSGLPLSLWQTNIYPKKVFEKLCKWLEIFVKDIYPWSIEEPWETHWGVIGGYTERAIALFNALEKKQGMKMICWRLDHRCGHGPKRLAVERFQYNPKHWVNQFDLNIHSTFEKTMDLKQFDESKVFEVKEQSLQGNVNQHTYIYKEKKDNITHLYLSCNGQKSKSIMLYAPKEEKNVFKKRYLAIQENLDKYELFYSAKAYSFWRGLKISNIYIVNRKENKVFSWKIKFDE